MCFLPGHTHQTWDDRTAQTRHCHLEADRVRRIGVADPLTLRPGHQGGEDGSDGEADQHHGDSGWQVSKGPTTAEQCQTGRG